VCNTEWLAGNELDLRDGVLTDAALRAVRLDGSPVDGVHVVGDIARFPNAAFDGVPRRVEHWSLPTDTGRRSGALLAGYLAGGGYPQESAGRFSCVPSFWSDLFELRLQSFGMIGLGDRVEIIEGDLAGPFVAGYYSGERLVGVVSLDMTKSAMPYRAQLAG
jgi:3-phenylpropionate/trans-cinnamate dioxygenase ferredoxin reductase component